MWYNFKMNKKYWTDERIIATIEQSLKDVPISDQDSFWVGRLRMLKQKRKAQLIAILDEDS